MFIPNSVCDNILSQFYDKSFTKGEKKQQLCCGHLWFIYSSKTAFGAETLFAPWPSLDKHWFQGCDFQVPSVFGVDACGDTNTTHRAGL